MENLDGKRVIVLSEAFPEDLARKINKLLDEHKNIRSIQYSSACHGSYVKYSALIIYK